MIKRKEEREMEVRGKIDEYLKKEEEEREAEEVRKR